MGLSHFRMDGKPLGWGCSSHVHAHCTRTKALLVHNLPAEKALTRAAALSQPVLEASDSARLGGVAVHHASHSEHSPLSEVDMVAGKQPA